MTFDFYVSPDPRIQNRALRFPASFGPELQSLPWVEDVQPARWGRVPFGDSQVMLFSADLARLGQRARLAMVEGNAAETNRKAAAGQGAIVSETFSLLHHIHLGDTVELGTPSGALRLPVAGVQVDYTDQGGSVVIDSALYQRYWHDDSVSAFRVYLQPGAPVEEARQAILRHFSGRGRMFVMTSGEAKQYVLRVADQWFSLSYVQLAVAILVAILGIVNSLTVSVIDRRRELGVLQAVGGLRSQVRRAIWTEAALAGFLGLVLGLALGAVMLWFNLRMEALDSFGYRWDYIYPVGFALLLLPVILSAAFVAALGPAQSAVSGPLIAALEYE
jgi:putative ABC transport system permease protein